jgi:hypothetical protein
MPSPSADSGLRELLLAYFIEISTSQELSHWLRELNQDSQGSVADKQERVRRSTKYLTMSAEAFPDQTRYYLDPLRSEHLAEICEALGVPPDGTRDTRYRRIMREVRYREGWMTRPVSGSDWTIDLVAPLVGMFPILKRGSYERDFYDAIEDELADALGGPNVHPQLAIAYGNSLKIDFHIGPANGAGVGLEVKMPTNNSDLQKAIGQLDQYQARYSSNLILLLLPDFINEAQKQMFLSAAGSRGITIIER